MFPCRANRPYTRVRKTADDHLLRAMMSSSFLYAFPPPFWMILVGAKGGKNFLFSFLSFVLVRRRWEVYSENGSFFSFLFIEIAVLNILCKNSYSLQTPTVGPTNWRTMTGFQNGFWTPLLRSFSELQFDGNTHFIGRFHHICCCTWKLWTHLLTRDATNTSHISTTTITRHTTIEKPKAASALPLYTNQLMTARTAIAANWL